MRYTHPLTIHHKITQAYWWNSLPNNIVEIRENVHRAIHTLFSEATPVKRIRQLIEADRLTYPDVYEAIDRVLKRFEGTMEINAYDPRLLDSDKFLRKQKHAK